MEKMRVKLAAPHKIVIRDFCVQSFADTYFDRGIQQ